MKNLQLYVYCSLPYTENTCRITGGKQRLCCAEFLRHTWRMAHALRHGSILLFLGKSDVVSLGLEPRIYCQACKCVIPKEHHWEWFKFLWVPIDLSPNSAQVCQQRTLTPPDTWSCSTLGLACVLMSRPISPELVLSPDFWVSNIPWYFSFALFSMWTWHHSTMTSNLCNNLKCYKNKHSFEICHWTWSSKLSCKISRRYDQPFSRKWRLKLLFLVIFRIFPN